MYELFYAEPTAAMGTRVILEEIGAQYRLIDTDITDHAPRAPELIKHNPNGWVPVLVHEDGAMHEASAITVFLVDRHPGAGLGPAADEPARGEFLQWLVYFSNTLQMAYQLTYYPWRFCELPQHHESARVRSCARLREIWGFIDAAIGDRPWMLGERFSAVDIHLFMLSTWLSAERGHPRIEEFSNADRIASLVAQRPAAQKVYG